MYVESCRNPHATKTINIPEQAFHVQDPDSVASDMDRIKKILDAKYEAADLKQVEAEIMYLSPLEKEQLLQLLKKFEPLFDGMLDKWKSMPCDIELREGIIPYHARPYPLPRVHEKTLHMELECLCKVGMLCKVNRSEWAVPSFIIPKKHGTVRFIMDFRELNA